MTANFFFPDIREMEKENQDRKMLSILRRSSLDGGGNNGGGRPARNVISTLPPFAIYMIIYSYDTALFRKWRERLFQSVDRNMISSRSGTIGRNETQIGGNCR